MGKAGASKPGKAWSFTAIMHERGRRMVGQREAQVVDKAWDAIREDPSPFISLAAGRHCWKNLVRYVLEVTTQKAQEVYGTHCSDPMGRPSKAGELRRAVPSSSRDLSPIMLKRATSLVKPQDAEDVVQTAWLRIRRYPRRFLDLAAGPDPQKEMTRYALSVTRNAANDLLGKGGSERDKVNEFARRMGDGLVAPSEVPDRWADEGVPELVTRILASLTPRDRELFRFYSEGVLLRDIPAPLGPAPADEPALKTPNSVAVHLARRIRPALAMAVRAQACLSSVARRAIGLYFFDGLSPEEVHLALQLPPRNTPATQLHDRKTRVGATVAFLRRLRAPNREIFRLYVFENRPVEDIAASLPRPCKGEPLSVGAVARRLRRVLKDYVETIGPLSA